MSGSGQYFDPMQINARLKNILMKGDTSELPGLIQEILMQSIANPITQALLAPLSQSLAAPLSQYFNSHTPQNTKYEPASGGEPAAAVSNSLDPQLFEIHGFAVIRTPVPEDVSEKDIKVLLTPTHITIKGDPSGNDHIIPLPLGTKKEGATAAFKDRVLEIRIPKENEAVAADEVNIQYL